MLKSYITLFGEIQFLNYRQFINNIPKTRINPDACSAFFSPPARPDFVKDDSHGYLPPTENRITKKQVHLKNETINLENSKVGSYIKRFITNQSGYYKHDSNIHQLMQNSKIQDELFAEPLKQLLFKQILTKSIDFTVNELNFECLDNLASKYIEKNVNESICYVNFVFNKYNQFLISCRPEDFVIFYSDVQLEECYTTVRPELKAFFKIGLDTVDSNNWIMCKYYKNNLTQELNSSKIPVGENNND